MFSVVLVTAPPFSRTAESSAALTKVDGREAILRSVELFLNRDEIKQIQLIVTNEMLEEVKRKHGGHLGFSGVKLSAAAPKFGDQIAAAAAKISPEATHVLVHDAARPAVPYTDIDALESMSSGKSAIVALSSQVRAAMAQLDEGGSVVGMVDATDYAQVVTPILFTKAKFMELANAKREPHASEISLLKGSSYNVRLSSAGEGALVKAMLSLMPKPKPRAASSPFEEAQW